jgi:hypothetical protein
MRRSRWNTRSSPGPRRCWVFRLTHRELPGGDDDHRQPNSCQRHVREAVSGSDAHERHELALGIGRLGGVAAPILGGYLLALGLAPTHIFLSACVFALIAATATALLAFRGNRAPVTGARDVAS